MVLVTQIKLMLPALEEDPGINSALTELCQVLRVGFEDKIAQVRRTFCVSVFLLSGRCGDRNYCPGYPLRQFCGVSWISLVACPRPSTSLSSTTSRRTLQVFLTTLDLLDAALVSIGVCKEARHNHVVAALEPTVATLLKKQGDGQARLRDGAMNGLVAVARCRTAGPVFVRYVLHALVGYKCLQIFVK